MAALCFGALPFFGLLEVGLPDLACDRCLVLLLVADLRLRQHVLLERVVARVRETRRVVRCRTKSVLVRLSPLWQV